MSSSVVDDTNLPNTAEEYIKQIGILNENIKELEIMNEELIKKFKIGVKDWKRIKKSGKSRVSDSTFDIKSVGVGGEDLKRWKEEHENLKKKIEDNKEHKKILEDLLQKDIKRFENTGEHPRRPTEKEGREWNPFVPTTPDYSPYDTPPRTPSPLELSGGKRRRKRKRTKKKKKRRRRTKKKRRRRRTKKKRRIR